MNRRIVGIGTGVVALLIAGWFYAGHRATVHARRAVDDMLMDSGLANSVTYSGIRASPFGTVWLRQLSITGLSDQPITIGELTINGLHQEAGVLESVKLHANDTTIPLSGPKWATAVYGAPSGALRSLLGVGIGALKGDVSLDYAFDDGTLALSSSGTFFDVGRWTASSRLVRVDRRWVSVAGRLLSSATRNREDPTDIGTVMETVSTLPTPQLADLSWHIDDTPLQNRLNLVPDTALPVATTPTDEQNAYAEAARVLGGRNVHGDNVSQNARALGHWRVKGGTLNFSTDITSPMPLYTADRGWGRPGILQDLGNFVARAHGTFSN